MASSGAPPLDVELTGVTRVTAGDFTTYTLSVRCERLRWHVRRRYSAFLALHSQLKAAFPSQPPPPLPWRVPLAGSHPLVVESRRVQLQKFLRQCLRLPHIAADPDFRQFLGERDQEQREREPLSGFGLSKAEQHAAERCECHAASARGLSLR